MGHWSEDLVDEAVELVGGNPDRAQVAELLGAAGRELELLSGRTFHPVRRTTSSFEPNGLPFVEIPDALVASIQSGTGVWGIPDPVDPEHATALQVVPLNPPVRNAAPPAEALAIAGEIVAELSQLGALSADYVLRWLGNTFDHAQRQQVLRRVMDPAVRFQIPVCGMALDGWWFQVTRRLIWCTSEMENEGRLIELLFPDATDGNPIPIAATEPVLIVARMTRQPVDWAISVRIWPEAARRPVDRPWSILAKAVHGHGIPTLTVDPLSTTEEVACQAILKGYWHGYISGDEPALVRAVERAYPKPVERIRRHTRVPNMTSAAATLLEQLLHPGFDPAQGAEATRRYVRRKASIVVMEHRKEENPEVYPWTQVGVSERRFYKLLPRFADKISGRYVYDQTAVVASMRAHLDELDHTREVRAAALDVLRSHGFREDAARKWLQRHRPEDALNAWPRTARSTDGATPSEQRSGVGAGGRANDE